MVAEHPPPESGRWQGEVAQRSPARSIPRWLLPLRCGQPSLSRLHRLETYTVGLAAIQRTPPTAPRDGRPCGMYPSPRRSRPDLGHSGRPPSPARPTPTGIAGCSRRGVRPGATKAGSGGPAYASRETISGHDEVLRLQPRSSLFRLSSKERLGTEMGTHATRRIFLPLLAIVSCAPSPHGTPAAPPSRLRPRQSAVAFPLRAWTRRAWVASFDFLRQPSYAIPPAT